MNGASDPHNDRGEAGDEDPTQGYLERGQWHDALGTLRGGEEMSLTPDEVAALTPLLAGCQLRLVELEPETEEDYAVFLFQAVLS